MERTMVNPVFNKLLPSAVGASPSTAANADEDLVLTVLAAVLRQLDGEGEPRNSYIYRCRYGGQVLISEREVTHEHERRRRRVP